MTYAVSVSAGWDKVIRNDIQNQRMRLYALVKRYIGRF
jgi:hypothetical protein